jgi:T-complex protein 1 subunit beta
MYYLFAEISKTQDEEVGDGTTTVAVLAGELLREGEKLVNQKLHPQLIIAGWRLARDAAKDALLSIGEYSE